MGTRGKKSADELLIQATRTDPTTPAGLNPMAAELFGRIVREMPEGHFTSADLILLREFCTLVTVNLPAVEKLLEDDPAALKHLSTKVMLLKTISLLAAKLRLAVSSRTRNDSAALKRPKSSGLIDFHNYFQKANNDEN